MYSNITDTYFLIDDFVIYKRTLGYKYDCEYRVIKTFQRYILEVPNKNITRAETSKICLFKRLL